MEVVGTMTKLIVPLYIVVVVNCLAGAVSTDSVCVW